MARSPRITYPDEPTVYHLISRTTLVGFPLGDEEKDYLLGLIRKFSEIYFVEILGFCFMGNHFHLLVRIYPGDDYGDEHVRARFQRCYGRHRKLLNGQIPHFRSKWSNLSEFMKDVKLSFTRYYNQRHDHLGYFWGDRFKSVIVENGDALINCLAYIDLNPVRAGLVKRPEDYRWSSIGWHVQTGNKGGLLSLDFGLPDHNHAGHSEQLRQYRRFLYEVGSLKKDGYAHIEKQVIEDARRRDYQIPVAGQLLFRSKYFTDSGIIGSKKFVAQIYRIIRHRLPIKREKTPHEINGLNGLFSFKKFPHDPHA